MCTEIMRGRLIEERLAGEWNETCLVHLRVVEHERPFQIGEGWSQQLDLAKSVPIAWLVQPIRFYVPPNTRVIAVIEDRTGGHLSEHELAVAYAPPCSV